MEKNTSQIAAADHTSQEWDEKLIRVKTLIVDTMKRDGIETIVIEYSGCGDSGDIDTITIEPEGINSRIEIDVKDVQFYRGNVVDGKATVSLHNAANDFANDLIDSQHSGYENNDGGSGTITISAADNSVTWEHNDYYTSSDTSDYVL